MKRMVILTIAIFLAWNSYNGQSEKKESENKAKLNIPKTDIKVNKEYDENGNLVKYDSTYSYYYLNIETDSILKNKVIDNLNKQFNRNYFFSYDPFINYQFFQDSLFKDHLFKNDLFSNMF
jgi:hypothetical protein